jgi:hypothetical protein
VVVSGLRKWPAAKIQQIETTTTIVFSTTTTSIVAFSLPAVQIASE